LGYRLDFSNLYRSIYDIIINGVSLPIFSLWVRKEAHCERVFNVSCRSHRGWCHSWTIQEMVR